MRASDQKLHDAMREIADGATDHPPLAQEWLALADRAAAGEWNDYFGKHEMPQHALVAELRALAERHPGQRENCDRLVARVIDGDFDGTTEESAEWASSEEGQAVMDELAQTDRGKKIVDAAVRSAVSDARESLMAQATTDPRSLGGSMVDNPAAAGSVMVDARHAVLVDSIDVCKLDDWSKVDKPVFLLLLSGRVNKTQDRANVLGVGDLDFMAGVITEMHGVAERAGVADELKALCSKRWAEMYE